MGEALYPGATRPLFTADAGGSEGYRLRQASWVERAWRRSRPDPPAGRDAAASERRAWPAAPPDG